jgi:TRAP-type mannitol/chloroaromatic compound transport system permease small subunit
MNALRVACRGIDKINEWVGTFVSWVTALVVVVVFVDVVMRYLFKTSFVFTQELEWHLFAFIFLMGAGYTLLKDGHVRVDIFYQQMSPQMRAWVNFIGVLLFLIPGCYLIIATSAKFVYNSWSVMEGSPDPGGIPYRYILKACIPAGFFLILLQGISLGLNSFLDIIEETGLLTKTFFRKLAVVAALIALVVIPMKLAVDAESALFFDYLPAWMFLALTILLMVGFPVTFTLHGDRPDLRPDRFRMGVFQSAAPAHLGGHDQRDPAGGAAVRLHGGDAGTLRSGRGAAGHHGTALRAHARGAGNFGGGRGGLLGASTGIVGATVVTMGLLAVPTMLKRGYQKELATGTVSASGTLGQIIPPSIVLVLIGDIVGVPVGDLFMGAVFPQVWCWWGFMSFTFF